VFAQTTHVGVSNQTLAAYTEWLDFLPAAEYPDPPNFCHRRKSAGKMTAAVNAAEFVKFGEPPQKLRLTFG